MNGSTHEVDGLGATSLPHGGLNTTEGGGSTGEGRRDGRGVLVMERSVEDGSITLVGWGVAHDNVSRGQRGNAGDGEGLGEHLC